MRTKLVPIGNSKGLRLPKALLDAAGIENAVELRLEDGKLTIAPVRRRRKPRQGWAESIRADVAKNGPLPPVDSDWEGLPNDWDDEGWKW